MIRQKKLGIYWGQKGLSLVEINKNEMVMFSAISFDSLEKNPIVGIKSLADDPRLLDLIQTSYRSARFSTIDTCFSLPSKDIIIRWFTIPWMKPSEIQGVVVFEARKYIPFPLEDLFFTYYPSVFSKGGVRQVGISFVAIRKATFNTYLTVLRQSGLNVVYAEPSALSLVRSLAFKRLIDTTLVTAIINFYQDSAEIVITSKGHVRFIRDFKISLADENLSEEQKGLVRAKMFNEVKMSLDFYARQQSDADVKSVITVSSGVNKEMWSGLGEDLGIAIRHVDLVAIFDKAISSNEGHVYALGTGLSGGVPSVVDLDLCEDQGAAKEIRASAAPIKAGTLIFSISVILVSAAIFFLANVWSQLFLTEREAQKIAIVQILGPYAEKPLETILTEKGTEIQNLTTIRSLKLRSTATSALVRLIKSIPEGVWFQGISFSIDQESESGNVGERGATIKVTSSMTIEGNVYLNSTNAEFEAASRFVDVLKDDKAFSGLFTNIKLKSSKKVTLGKIQATAFVINCE
ncbi:MAG: pilus assembly protein PilM [Candidatus Omnitrophica bacterium]|nr:pilus assembly protein PilM [Candidatus Omnitrophota bacterium]